MLENDCPPASRSLLILRKKDAKATEASTNHLANDESMTDSSEDEYKPLLSDSWSSEKPYYTVNS